MGGHRDLIVWQKAMTLVTEIYQVTRCFPADEVCGLRSQLRRAAVSVPSNIAEGYGRSSPKELHQFISNARGSLAEIETQLEICRNLGLLKMEAADSLLSSVGEIGRMLTGLRAWSQSAGR